MRRLSITARARADVLAAFFWLDERNPNAAARWFDAVHRKFLRLTEMPGIGARRAEVLPRARSVVVRPYVVYYRADEDVVEILRVLHGSRDHDAIFAQRAEMLLLTCPNCGAECAETELAAGGEAHLVRFGPGSSDDAFADYMFGRKNPKGVHFERWRHAHGCGKWFHAARCTATLEVFGTYPAQTTEPPAEILDRVKARRPGWQP